MKSGSDLGPMLTRGWLSERSEAFRSALLDGARRRRYAEGEAVYRYGDTAQGLYGVIDGAVTITIPADDGQEFTANREGQGFWIGDLAMLSNQTRLITVIAHAPTEMLVIPTPHIQRILQEKPVFYREFYALNHANTELALRLLANLAVASADRRLILRLLMFEERLDAGDGWIDVGQENLAAMVAVSVPTLQRKLRSLGEAGLIEQGYGRIRILDRARLLESCQS